MHVDGSSRSRRSERKLIINGILDDLFFSYILREQKRLTAEVDRKGLKLVYIHKPVPGTLQLKGVLVISACTMQ